MSGMAGDIARALDAALRFRDAGITPDPWQEVAIRSQSRRQLWNVHRQGGKSTTAALKALAKATSSPGSLTLLVSPAQRQSAELLRRVTELHGKIAGLPKPVFESMHRLEFDPAVGGRILSLPSSEATVRGYSRVGLAVLDECARIPDGIIGAIKPMQATAKDAELIALSTPNGEAGIFPRAVDARRRPLGAHEGHGRAVRPHRPGVPGRGARAARRDALPAGIPLRVRRQRRAGVRQRDHRARAVPSRRGAAMAVIAGIVPELSVDYPPSPPVFLQRGPSRFAVGVDLAQANDWTAVSVIEHKCGVLDRNTELERHCGIGVHPQVKTEFFDLRHIERVRGVSYVDIVARLKSLMMTPPLCGDGRTPPAELIVDATGVGRGVADLISDSGLAFIGVVITGGNVTTHADGNFWHVSKLDLVSRLDGKLHSGALRIAAALKEAPNLAEELKNFRRAVSASGRATFGARATAQDDLVLSCALPIWWLGRPPIPRIVVGGY